MGKLIKDGINYSGQAALLDSVCDGSAQAAEFALTAKQGNVLANDIGTVEGTDTAQYSHAVGEYFIWKGQFVKTLSAIAVNDTIVSGVNVSSTSVSAILSQVNSAKTISASSADLLGYSSATNLFTVPSDGYLEETNSTVDSTVTIFFQIGNTSNFISDLYKFDNRFMSHIIFVKKGMKLFVQDNTANCQVMYRALVDR